MKSSAGMAGQDFDEIDEAMADPIIDHTPETAPLCKVNRVIEILDELDREKSHGRFIR